VYIAGLESAASLSLYSARLTIGTLTIYGSLVKESKILGPVSFTTAESTGGGIGDITFWHMSRFNTISLSSAGGPIGAVSFNNISSFFNFTAATAYSPIGTITFNQLSQGNTLSTVGGFYITSSLNLKSASFSNISIYGLDTCTDFIADARFGDIGYVEIYPPVSRSTVITNRLIVSASYQYNGVFTGFFGKRIVSASSISVQSTQGTIGYFTVNGLANVSNDISVYAYNAMGPFTINAETPDISLVIGKSLNIQTSTASGTVIGMVLNLLLYYFLNFILFYLFINLILDFILNLFP
jgi:hypothetical protein